MPPRPWQTAHDRVPDSWSKLGAKSAIPWRERLDGENWPLSSRQCTSVDAMLDNNEVVSVHTVQTPTKKVIRTANAESASSRALETAVGRSRQLPLRPSTAAFECSQATSQSSETPVISMGEVLQDRLREFELVERPAEVEAMSDTESDSSGLVEIRHEDARSPSESSCRSPSVRFKIDGDWDTDWQLL